MCVMKYSTVEFETDIEWEAETDLRGEVVLDRDSCELAEAFECSMSPSPPDLMWVSMQEGLFFSTSVLL